jgi:hypothetical protein
MIHKHRTLMLALIYLLLIYALVFLLAPEQKTFLSSDTGLLESLTSIGFLIASLLFVFLFLKLRGLSDYTWLRRLSYLALALFFLFAPGQEISWGQQLLHLISPEANLPASFQQILGTLFNLFWLAFTLLIPLSAQFLPRLRSLYEKFMPLVPWEFGILFLANWAIAQFGSDAARSNSTLSFTASELLETKESHYAVLFVILALYLYLTSPSKANEETSA